jgi:hypothetical protein
MNSSPGFPPGGSSPRRTVLVAYRGKLLSYVGDKARFPRRQELDDAVPNHPVLIIHWGGQFGVAIFCDSASYGLAELEGHLADLHTTLAHEVRVSSYGSDQLSYWAARIRKTEGHRDDLHEQGNQNRVIRTWMESFSGSESRPRLPVTN